MTIETCKALILEREALLEAQKLMGVGDAALNFFGNEKVESGFRSQPKSVQGVMVVGCQTALDTRIKEIEGLLLDSQKIVP
jgi:hypothetical protein